MLSSCIWGCSDNNWGGDWLLDVNLPSYLRVQVVSETDVICGVGMIVDNRKGFTQTLFAFEGPRR